MGGAGLSVDVLLAHGWLLELDAQERRVMKPYPPLGLLYVASHLRARGFEVGVLDPTFRTWPEVEAELRRLNPSIVGLYCTLMTKPTVVRLAALCHALRATVVVGGPEPAADAERWLQHAADVVVIGEGELTLEELIPRLQSGRDLGGIAGIVYREDGRVVRTPPRALIRDLDAQPLPARDAIDVDAYLRAWRERHGHGALNLTASRGCPYTCRWCSRSVFGDSHRRRSPSNVADEVAHLKERWAPDRLWFVDDVFTIHRGWLHAFADEMQRRALRVPFECISRPERIDAQVADDLARLGCARLWIGSESGSQRVLDRMDRRITVEQVRASTRLLQQRGIEVGMFIMLGYEGEDESDLAATIDHLREARPDVFLTTVTYPIKGTPYHSEVQDRILPDGDWASATDRGIRLRGGHTRRYYESANEWVVGSVERHRRWHAGRYAAAAAAGARAAMGRLKMAMYRGERES